MADTKISGLSAATVAAAANEFAINEAGTSKKVSASQLGVLMPFLGVYAPGSFTIASGSFGHMAKGLILTGSQRGTLQGTARLRIN
jgi:hypothetical protein